MLVLVVPDAVSQLVSLESVHYDSNTDYSFSHVFIQFACSFEVAVSGHDR